MIITDDGTIIRTPAEDISRTGRATQGVRLMRVAEGSRIVDVARAEREPQETNGENGQNGQAEENLSPDEMSMPANDENADSLNGI